MIAWLSKICTVGSGQHKETLEKFNIKKIFSVDNLIKKIWEKSFTCAVWNTNIKTFLKWSVAQWNSSKSDHFWLGTEF